jgi:hypothetical protein
MSHPRHLASFPAVLAALLVLATPAGAAPAKGPHYTLKISEGESTLPEWESVAFTSGSVDHGAQVAVSIVRGGLTVYRDVGEGSAGFSQVPQVGDVVTLESPVGTPIGSTVYDGLPSVDQTVCAGSTNFSGANSPGEVVEGFFVTRALTYDSYGHPIGTHQTASGEAQVKTLSGTTFGGVFLVPLQLGEDVIATESLKTPLAGEATYTYISEMERPVGNCPPPVQVTPPPAAPPVLSGGLAKVLRTSIKALLKSGAKDSVRINQPGTVIQDLYLKGGSVPAFASGVKHHKVPPALLLARGSATAKTAGTLRVTLRLTRHGRARLRSAHKVTAVLVTTLRTGGARLSLPRRTLTLHR